MTMEHFYKPSDDIFLELVFNWIQFLICSDNSYSLKDTTTKWSQSNPILILNPVFFCLKIIILYVLTLYRIYKYYQFCTNKHKVAYTQNKVKAWIIIRGKNL